MSADLTAFGTAANVGVTASTAPRNGLSPATAPLGMTAAKNSKSLLATGPLAPAVEVHDLVKTYRSGWWRPRVVPALQGVSLTVPRGEIFGLLGPNGAGKTTLIKVLLGIVRKTAGAATVLGEPAGSLAARRRVGYLPENNRVPRHQTAAMALEYFGGLSGLSPREVRARQTDLLAMVGLSGRETMAVRQFSKGMQQRLGLAQALLHDPELLILDEPTDGVDPVGRAELRDVLTQLRAAGKTIFLNSHHLQEMELICDRVMIMNHGRVLHCGRIDDLTRHQTIRFTVSGPAVTIRAVLTAFPSVHSADALAALVSEPDDPRDAGDTIATDNVIIATHVDSAPDLAGNDSPTLSFPWPEGDQAELDRLLDALRAARISLIELARGRQSLEESFLAVLGEGKAG